MITFKLDDINDDYSLFKQHFLPTPVGRGRPRTTVEFNENNPETRVTLSHMVRLNVFNNDAIEKLKSLGIT